MVLNNNNNTNLMIIDKKKKRTCHLGGPLRANHENEKRNKYIDLEKCAILIMKI